ncbi:hypothetical protein [Streptomyces varsoviensis]|uniref:Uncharacterized protein n=1 Tax=Streptomyces varsoviensis TaxID=67373 RepID=A0ABR5J8Y7_9ACTN|nr:hypothetical protein [Streptomyces varsoviensis]KOG89911.1 hypothetical protein ADK38_11615 [Streptomyces varsoviensis]
MPNPVNPVTLPAAEPESLAELRGDCARMASRWTPPETAAPGPAPAPVPPTRLHGVSVPVSSARLLDGMSEYGD